MGQLDGWGQGEGVWRELGEGTQTEKTGTQREANQILVLYNLLPETDMFPKISEQINV